MKAKNLHGDARSEFLKAWHWPNWMQSANIVERFHEFVIIPELIDGQTHESSQVYTMFVIWSPARKCPDLSGTDLSGTAASTKVVLQHSLASGTVARKSGEHLG